MDGTEIKNAVDKADQPQWFQKWWAPLIPILLLAVAFFWRQYRPVPSYVPKTTTIKVAVEFAPGGVSELDFDIVPKSPPDNTPKFDSSEPQKSAWLPSEINSRIGRKYPSSSIRILESWLGKAEIVVKYARADGGQAEFHYQLPSVSNASYRVKIPDNEVMPCVTLSGGICLEQVMKKK